MLKTVTTIAGADAGAAAGVHADLRTIQNHGLHGTAVISAVTAQGSANEYLVQPIADDLFRRQLLMLLDSFEVCAVKTGMLASPSQVEIIAADLPTSIPLIIDPVLESSAGIQLIDEVTRRAMLHKLLPRATLITPNLPELSRLAGDGEQLQLAGKLLHSGCAAVLVKGGHAAGDRLDDCLYETNRQQIDMHRFTHSRQPGQYRGTGCVLSAAICAAIANQGLTRGQSLEAVCRAGIDYLQSCIRHTPTPRERQAAILRHPKIDKDLSG